MADSMTTTLTSATDGAAAGPSTRLELLNLTKSYGPVHAMRDVSFSASAGEVVGLVGDNGACKSTLVKCLSGIVRPDSGRIMLNGQSVVIESPKAARHLGIETVHQDLALIDTLDVTANLFLNREKVVGRGPLQALGWLNNRRMHREAKAILDGLRINIPSVRHPIERLSGGQRQAVAVGRAVAWGQRIVVMDEPSAALGVEQTRLVLQLIITLRDQGVLVLFISHNMQQVLDVCTRAVVMRHGSVVADIETARLTTRDLVDHITGQQVTTR